MGGGPRAFRRRALIALLLAAAAAGESPRAFVEQTYANYAHPDYSPFGDPSSVFAAGLVAAIKEDQRLAHGEVGFLDGDPLCDCQDTGGMHARITSVLKTGTKATARVLVSFEGSGERRKIRLELIRTAKGWRIADIGTPDETSLLHDLEKANAKARRSR